MLEYKLRIRELSQLLCVHSLTPFLLLHLTSSHPSNQPMPTSASLISATCFGFSVSPTGNYSPREEKQGCCSPSWASPYLHEHGLDPQASRLVDSELGFITMPEAGWGHGVTYLPVLPGGAHSEAYNPFRQHEEGSWMERGVFREARGGHQNTQSKDPQIAPNRKHSAITTLVSHYLSKSLFQAK